MSYQYDARTRVWAKPGTTSIAYSDGDEAEEYLSRLLKRSVDVSSTSSELRAGIRDWESEYHLSASRHNLLRPMAIDASHKVLELGCGCGALTRYLGETGASVIAVEGSIRRAGIAAERCRDLENVNVYCDNISKLDLPLASFDVVTLIGVLEYANLFINSPDPTLACLQLARSWLKADGRLIIAIENQFGLKYFSGSPEDHVGIPYFGVQNLYTRQTVQTFGRVELAQNIHAAGFLCAEFLYPFPDYKLPKLVLHQDALNQAGFSAANLLLGLNGADRRENEHKHFSDGLVWDGLEKNGMLADMANSFLVVARQQQDTEAQPARLATHFSDNRAAQYACETRFEGLHEIRVSKRSMYPHAAPLPAKQLTQHLEADSPYIDGHSYVRPLMYQLAAGAGIAEIADWARPWFSYLRQMADGGVLPGDCVDAIPGNLIARPDETLVLIDKEWQLDNPPSLDWVFVRGLIYTLQNVPSAPALGHLNYRQLVQAVADRLAFGVAIDFASISAREDAFQRVICAPGSNKHSFAEILDPPLSLLIPGSMVADADRKARQELQRIHNSRSWKITRPLRVLDRLWQRVRAGAHSG